MAVEFRTPKLSDGQARQRFAGLLAEAVGRSSTAVKAVADCCHVTARQLQRWRDPEDGDTMPASAILLLPGDAARELLASLASARRAIYGEPVAGSLVSQLLVALRTNTALSSEIASAVADNHVSADERAAIKAGIAAQRRDLDRVEALLDADALLDAARKTVRA